MSTSSTPVKTRVNTPPALSLTRTPTGTVKRTTSNLKPTTPGGGATTPRSGAAPAGAQNISVGVRVRAFQKEENKELAIRMKDSTCEIHVPHRGRFPFSFDQCFWSNDVEDDQKNYSSQEDVFEQLGRPLVDNAMDGFNSSIIAYGQTGSGKTYSIFGPQDSLGTEHEGLIPRVCNDIFQRLRTPMKGVQHKVFVSIIEVYLEDVYDLLQRRKELKVRGDSSHGFSVVGLKSIPVESYHDVLKLLKQADSYKTFAATAIHDRSSRAHTLFQLELRTITEKTTRTARVVLADLAGSERVKAAQTDTGVGFEQARNINLSLLNLGTCIEAVVNRCKNGQSVANIGEFRQSTLTKLLKDFIGGNSRTAMLVTVAPSIQDVNHSIQTLRFADRAKQIQCHAVINTELNSDSVQLKEEIAKVYEKKKQLLDKECELDMQSSMIKKKQAELEKRVYEVTEEKRKLKDQLTAMTAEERARLAQREADIEARLKALQRELSDSEQQREALDDKYLEMVCEQQAMQQDKEDMSAEHARVLEEFETYKNEVAQQTLFIQMEHAQVVASLEDKLKASEVEFKEFKTQSRSRADALAVDNSRKMADLIREHDADNASIAKDHATAIDNLRKKMMSLEEDLAEATNKLNEKNEQCDVLAMAHSKSSAHIVTQDERLAELTMELSSNKMRLEQADDRILELSEGSTEQKDIIATLHKQLAAAEENHASTITEMKNTHGNEVLQLRETITAAEVKFDSEKKALDAKNVELELQCREIMEELTQVSGSLQQSESDGLTNQKELRRLNDEVARATAMEEDLRAKVKQLEAELAEEKANHSQTQRKWNATTATLDETEVQLQACNASLQAEQRTSQNFRRQLLNSRNSYDVAYQQCVAAQNALSIVFQQNRAESEAAVSNELDATTTSISSQSRHQHQHHAHVHNHHRDPSQSPFATSPPVNHLGGSPSSKYPTSQPRGPLNYTDENCHNHGNTNNGSFSGSCISTSNAVYGSPARATSQSPPTSPMRTVGYVG